MSTLSEALDAYRDGDDSALRDATSMLSDPLEGARRRIRAQAWEMAEAFVHERDQRHRSFLFGYFSGLALALMALEGEFVWIDRGDGTHSDS